MFTRSNLSKTILYKNGISISVPTESVDEYLSTGWSRSQHVEQKTADVLPIEARTLSIKGRK